MILAGASGAGKSDTALRLIVEHGAILVSDDQTEIRLSTADPPHEGELWVSPPPALAGLIEVRHVGLMRIPFQPQARACLYVELVTDAASLPRLPDAGASINIHGVALRRIMLPAYAASNPAKILAALRYPLDDTV